MTTHRFLITVEDSDDELDAEWWADLARGACDAWAPSGGVTFTLVAGPEYRRPADDTL